MQYNKVYCFNIFNLCLRQRTMATISRNKTTTMEQEHCVHGFTWGFQYLLVCCLNFMFWGCMITFLLIKTTCDSWKSTPNCLFTISTLTVSFILDLNFKERIRLIYSASTLGKLMLQSSFPVLHCSFLDVTPLPLFFRLHTPSKVD